MKKLIIILITVVALSASALNVNYTVTNDLNTTVGVFYWTNTLPGAYALSLSNNIAPGAHYVFSLATNGPAGLGVSAVNGTAFTLIPWAQIQGTNTYSSQLFSSAMVIAAPASETVPQIQSVLRSYFVTGAVPTEENYWEFIDTMFWYANYFATNAAAAAESATSISNMLSSSPTIRAFYSGYGTYGGSYVQTSVISGLSPTITVDSYIDGYPSLLTFTFSNAMPDTNYIVISDGESWYGAASYRTTSTFEISILKTPTTHGPSLPSQFEIVR